MGSRALQLKEMRSNIILRCGFYCGLAQKHFGDFSPAARIWGRIEEFSDEQLLRISQEIHDRLVSEGIVAADEDPWTSSVSKVSISGT